MTDLNELLAVIQQLQGESSAETLGTMSDDDLALHALDNRFGGNLAYSRSLGWATFGEHHWAYDSEGDDVLASVQTMLRDLRKSEKDQKRSQYLGSRQRRDSVVEMLKGLPEVRYSGPWDTQEHLLAAPNGVIDLRTGELLDGEPDQRITRAVTVPYDPAAECPRWEQFLAEIFADDPEMPAYIQRLLGYGITGSNAEQCFAVLWGSGSNGKSTFLNTLHKLMGQHAVTVPFDMFTTSGKARGGPEAEMLVGARLALASETNRSAVLDSAAIKNATGGEEITVNPKYRKPYAFKPQALILLATNYKPSVKEQDHGTWRRVKLIPFTQKFEGARKDLSLDDKLSAELPGILAWLVRGAVAWYAEGLPEPKSIGRAVEEYKDESDTLAGFFPGVIVPDPSSRMPGNEIWKAYQGWALDEGNVSFHSQRALTMAMRERCGDMKPYNSSGKRGFSGIRLAGDPSPAGPGIFAAE